MSGRGPRAGYILVEASVLYAILALALVALVPLFILAVRASKNAGRIAVGAQLCAELLEEVRLRRWDELTPTPRQGISTGSPYPFASDPGEPRADKRSFDDVDDFDGWSESPPKDPLNQDIPELSAFSRTVTVAYALEVNPDAASAAQTDLKRVTVCARWRQAPPQCLSTLLANR